MRRLSCDQGARYGRRNLNRMAPIPPRITRALEGNESPAFLAADLAGLDVPAPVRELLVGYLEALYSGDRMSPLAERCVIRREHEARMRLARSISPHGAPSPLSPSARRPVRLAWQPKRWNAKAPHALSVEVAGEPGTQWLNENDPEAALATLANEMDAAAAAHGLSLDDSRAALAVGRPSEARNSLRWRLATALAPIYVGGANRTAMATVLGCSRPALYGLMKTITP